MKLYLVRHGQSQWQLRPNDNWDTSLTDIGHEQSRRLGLWLADPKYVDHQARIEITSLLVSPLKRAQETAFYISEALGLPMIIRDKLTEADFHVSEHLPHGDEPMQTCLAYEPSTIYTAFKSKARDALRELIEKAEATGGPVLAVTHGALIKTMLRLVAGSDAVSFRLYNTGLNLIEWNTGRWHLVHLNLWDHLPVSLRTL
jgi:broad specificity phosphatase PhoE